MKTKITATNKMLILSVAFTMILLAIRIALTNSLTYLFFVWNIFLAIIPLVSSNYLLKQQKLGIKSIIIIFGWLFFYPNAPYIITDFFHYVERPPVPYWFDLLICISAVWNGLILGLISLIQVEAFLSRHLKPTIVKAIVLASFLLCGYGIYIGRFLRFNSWDIVTDIDGLFDASLQRIIHPFHHTSTWSFTLLFAVMMAVFYYTIKSISQIFINKNTSIMEL
jgi:uncharacterized membrane protein